MGFIYGIVDFGAEDVSEKELTALGEHVKWPDFESNHFAGDHFRWGYCHRPDRDSKISWFTKDGVTVIAEARVYNKEDFFQNEQLHSNAEAFFWSYKERGIKWADYVNGDFAVVIIDSIQRSVLLFRDHIGARPLVYSHIGEKLVFSSHEFGIAASGIVSSDLDEVAFLASIPKLGINNSARDTSFKYIKKVIPGFCASFAHNEIEEQQYWFPENIATNYSLSLEEAEQGLRERMLSATIARMEDGKLGAHLSGGLDSSGIAAIVAKNMHDPSDLIGYSWTPDSFECEIEKMDERLLIEDFAKETGVSLKYFKVANDNHIPKFDNPEFERMSNELATMRDAEEDGVSILFSGWGGDEFASLSLRGAINYIVLNARVIDLIRWIKRFGVKNTLVKIRDEVLPYFFPSMLKDDHREEQFFSLFKAPIGAMKDDLYKKYGQRFIYGFGNRKGFMLNLIHLYHLSKRMESWCYFGERYGLEYKYPLTDKSLVEFYLSIPPKYGYERMVSRSLFREALKGILPEMIRTRPNKHEDIFQHYRLGMAEQLRVFLGEDPDLLQDFKGNKLFNMEHFRTIVKQPSANIQGQIMVATVINIFLRYRGMIKKYGREQSLQ